MKVLGKVFGKKMGPVITSAISLLVCVSLATSMVWAASGDIVAILKGKPAPFSGILLTEDVYKEYVQMDADLQAERAKRESLERELEQTKAALMAQINQLEQEKAAAVADRDKCQYLLANPSWEDKPGTNRWIGFGLGVGACGLAVYGAGQLRQ